MKTIAVQWSADYVERIARDMLTVTDAAVAQEADGVTVDVDDVAALDVPARFTSGPFCDANGDDTWKRLNRESGR